MKIIMDTDNGITPMDIPIMAKVAVLVLEEAEMAVEITLILLVAEMVAEIIQIPIQTAIILTLITLIMT
jgi:hypothetical protein